MSNSQSALTYENVRVKEFVQKVIEVFQYQNVLLATHPNATIYNTLSSLLTDAEFGLYLEADPCFICNNIESSIGNFKLNAIKSDARFTTNQQIFKLSSSHALSKILIKISEIRKSKMISVINVYYTSKSTHSIVDLKMNNRLWSKAKRVHVSPAQQEVKIEFQLPIIASNLMIEYADFYERDAQAGAEGAVLQCPRCSAPVPAHPGVCNTCGENVFQCHKCRAINYDERDPFLCNACGFCKFAKFELNFVGRPCNSVELIENEEDRRLVIQNISGLLERADKVYYALSQHSKPTLEALVVKLNEQNTLDKFSIQSSDTNAVNKTNSAPGTAVSAPQPVNPVPPSSSSSTAAAASSSTSTVLNQKTGQSIVQKYTVECKSKFDELAKIIFKLNLCRKELREYDKQFKTTNGLKTAASSAAPSRKNSIVFESNLDKMPRFVSPLLANLPRNNCYGCALASLEHCVTLFRALLCSSQLPQTNQQNAQLITHVKSELCRNNILEEIVNFNLRRVHFCPSGSNATTPQAPQVQTNPTNPTQTTAATTATTTSTTTNPSTSPQSNPQSSNQHRLFDRDLVNLAYLLIKDNPEGSERFETLLKDKVDIFLSSVPESISTSNLSCLPYVSSVYQLSGGSAHDSPLKHELTLLAALMHKQDDICWESRLRLVLHVLLRSLNISKQAPSNPVIIESLTLPCLRILNHVCKTTTNIALVSSLASSISNVNKTTKPSSRPPTLFTPLQSTVPANSTSTVPLNRFLSEPTDVNYIQLQSLLASSYISNAPSSIELDPVEFLASKTYFDKWLQMSRLVPDNSTQIKSKYFTAWRKFVSRRSRSTNKANDLNFKWLKQCLFCTSSRSVRQLTCSVFQSIFGFYASCSTPQNNSSNTADLSYSAANSKKFQMAEALSELLNECCVAGESFGEYLTLLKTVLNDRECKYMLVIRCGILSNVEALILKEIRQLGEIERLSELGGSVTNLTCGFTIKCLSELLGLFLKEANIKNKYKSRLIATVLNAYLSLKKLVYQRTKLIDEAQEKMLSILEQITSGTEAETRKFMAICIDTVNNFELDDLVTPVFIFERLCNIIYPEEVVDNKEFLMILDKDPNQEDYLQGRMLGNPYSSNEPGLGPLMRNVKNKICTDCELVALLDDDNGMELLVNNKIISLDLAVRDVYKKVWLSEVLSEHEPMRVVYRMTGLSGDATEDIIDNLEGKGNEQLKNDEDVYRMSAELANNTALQVMLERLSSINQQNLALGKPLLAVLLKLFDYALKLGVNRKVLIRPEMKTVSIMLQTLNMMLKVEQVEPGKIGMSLAEKLLSIMECVLSEASQQAPEIYSEFSSSCGDTEQLEFLLNNIKCAFVRSQPNLLQALMRLIPFLSFGDENKMDSLISYFSTYYSRLDEFDALKLSGTSSEHLLHLECFCVIVNGIEVNPMGRRLRDMMFDGQVAHKAIENLIRTAPNVTTFLNSDFDIWKDFINRNSLPYILRILTGLCRSHEAIQDLIGESCIPLLHKLEQFSSGNLVGILAEDLLLALKQNPSSKVAAAIEQVRTQTRNEKKKLAMAMRQKQLNQLGMKANEKGQLIARDPKSFKSVADEMEEEKGHVCCICREGYKYHPQKVLAIYTFSKKAELEPVYESKTRKTAGYSTVTHFNLVHIDCHTNAIRSARTCRDEWENAALQNANTKCNGILPIWGPDVTETVFSNALARFVNRLLFM